MKNFLIAVLIATLLCYSFGNVMQDWFGMHINFDGNVMDSFGSIIGMVVVGVVLTVIGFVVALSVVGAIVLAVVAGAIGIFVAGLASLWPILLVAFVLIYLVKDKRKPDNYHYSH